MVTVCPSLMLRRNSVLSSLMMPAWILEPLETYTCSTAASKQGRGASVSVTSSCHAHHDCAVRTMKVWAAAQLCIIEVRHVDTEVLQAADIKVQQPNSRVNVH